MQQQFKEQKQLDDLRKRQAEQGRKRLSNSQRKQRERRERQLNDRRRAIKPSEIKSDMNNETHMEQYHATAHAHAPAIQPPDHKTISQIERPRFQKV